MPGKHWVSGSNPAHRKSPPSIITLHITATSANLRFHHELSAPVAEKL
jgi:hypothetical protein